MFSGGLIFDMHNPGGVWTWKVVLLFHHTDPLTLERKKNIYITPSIILENILGRLYKASVSLYLPLGSSVKHITLMT